ncbi:hypothetical protein EX30DRAFT_340707 [Ascodesmis nigricans]|uniref:Uncharacterized protein n=1 Tax=Ascodesmis nigricans TaxID=341454 RepID=A0A4S2MXK2_9PEZI|nr:hypothetical protein EX30DRAFT_340707 [Ascodesmis nigricans]
MNLIITITNTPAHHSSSPPSTFLTTAMPLIIPAKSTVFTPPTTSPPTPSPQIASPNPTVSSASDTTPEIDTTSWASNIRSRTSWRFSTFFTNGAGHDAPKYPSPSEDTVKGKGQTAGNRYSSIYMQENRPIMVKKLRDERRRASVFGFDMVNRLFTTEEEKEKDIVEEVGADDTVERNEIQMPTCTESNKAFTPRTRTNLSPFLGTELRKEYVLKKAELEEMTRQLMNRRRRTKFLVGGVRENFEEPGKMKTDGVRK